MAIAPDPLTITCDKAPAGWKCRREHGHEGSCAALPLYRALWDPEVAQAQHIAKSLFDLGVSETLSALHEVLSRKTDPEYIRYIIEDVRDELADRRRREIMRANPDEVADIQKEPPWPI